MVERLPARFLRSAAEFRVGAPASVQRAFAYGDPKKEKARLAVNVVDDWSVAISTQMTSDSHGPGVADVPLSEARRSSAALRQHSVRPK